MDALVNYFACKKSQLALATPTHPGGPNTLSTGGNRQVLCWTISSTANLCTARGSPTHRIYATAL